MKIKVLVFFIVLITGETLFSQGLTTEQNSQLKKMVAHDQRLYGDEYSRTKTYYLDNYVRQVKYSTTNEKNNTETSVYIDKVKKWNLTGIWNLVDPRQYNLEVYISHCPALYNEDGIILECSISEIKNNVKSSYDLLKSEKVRFEKYYKDKVDGFRLVHHDTINNYCFYKKKELHLLTNEVTDVYFIVGVKNKKTFRYSLFNFKEENYIDIDKFFTDCYIRNR